MTGDAAAAPSDRRSGVHVREHGSSSDVVVLLHGHSQSGRAWEPIAERLGASGRRALVPDLPGIGRSAPVPGGHRKRHVAGHLREALAPRLAGARSVSVVGHDLGAMVAYAWTAGWPSEVDRLCVMETPVPGPPPWEDILKMPQAWHFGFRGPFARALLDGREHIYLERFWTEMSARPDAIGAADRSAYVEAYRTPGALEASFDYFATFAEDAADNLRSATAPLDVPVLAVGGALGMGAAVGLQARLWARDVTELVIDGAAHYPADEDPDAVFDALDRFLPRTESTPDP